MRCHVDDNVQYDLYVFQGKSCLRQTETSHAADCKKE